MSGLVSDALNIANTIFGAPSLTLGSVQFSATELPTSMPIGGKQMVVPNKLPGGQRIIDVMGPDEEDKTWSGIFYGQNASTRIRLVDAIRKAGATVTLAWDVFSYQVLVTSFHADNRADGANPYSITCLVVADNSAQQGETLPTVAGQVVTDLELGQPIAALSAVSGGVAVPVNAAGSAVTAPNAFSPGSADYTAASNAVNMAAAEINTTVASVDTELGGYGLSLGQLGTAASAAIDYLPAIGAINGAVESSGDMANLMLMQGYVTRAAANLAMASA